MKILFVCHGNICRSPMAEFVFKDLVHKEGLDEQFYIESAATSTEELGNPVYPPARRKLEEHGIDCSYKRARQIKKSDYDDFDLIIAMDEENLYYMGWVFRKDYLNKIHLLMEYTDRPGEVADPWYTRDFDRTYDDVLEGCRGLLDYLHKTKGI